MLSESSNTNKHNCEELNEVYYYCSNITQSLYNLKGNSRKCNEYI